MGGNRSLVDGPSLSTFETNSKQLEKQEVDQGRGMGMGAQHPETMGIWGGCLLVLMLAKNLGLRCQIAPI